MIIDESLANIERCVRNLRENDPHFETKPPIVASPQWWIDEVKVAFKEKMTEATDEIEQIHGVRLLLRAELQEPFVISGGGKVYPVLPGWARAANVGRSSVKTVDSIFEFKHGGSV